MIKKLGNKKEGETPIKKIEIWTELLNLEPKLVQLSQIYLDPNNPRTQKPGKKIIEDWRILEEKIQERCMEEMEEIGIADLISSIKNSGFWTIDRVVLRPLNAGKYVVVEGNRRIAALKKLFELHKTGEITLLDNILKGIEKFEALIYKGKNPDIAWLIQGFRHTPGVKEWGDYPKAKFLATIREEVKLDIRDIAATLGMDRKDVNELIRSYRAFQQAKEDEDYGDKITPEKFGFFHEILLKKPSLKEWAGWNEENQKFIKEENFKRYLKWITRKELNLSISPTTRDTLAKLVKSEHEDLLEKFEEGSLGIEECSDIIRREEEEIEPIDLSKTIRRLRQIEKMVLTLPIPQLQRAKKNREKKQKKELIELMKKLVDVLQSQIKNLT